MINHNDYYYKGYDITNKNRLEKIIMEHFNPYGYNIDSNNKRVIDYDKMCCRTNQDCIKNKEYNQKNNS